MDLEDDQIINLRDFLEKRTSLLAEDHFVRNKDVKKCLKADLNLPDAAFEKLDKLCNPSLLNPDDKQRDIKSLDDLDDCGELSMIDYMKNVYKKPLKRNQPIELKFLKNLSKLNEIEPDDENRIELPDLVLTVQLSQPLNSKLNKLSWSEDYLVLGQNYLTDLKDSVSCFKNEIKLGEFSDNPDLIKKATPIKEIIKSGYFFIENTIYNDLRQGNNDCSTTVLKWAKDNNIGHLDTKSMEETRFIDLDIRIGFPYLYSHLGNCEHLLIFTSVKLINPSIDCYDKTKYPILKDKIRTRFTFCWCCNKIYAKWVVCNSKYAVDDPTFLCDRCLKNTHYTDTQLEHISEEKEGEEEEEVDKPVSNEANNNQNEENSHGHKKLFDFKAYHFSQL